MKKLAESVKNMRRAREELSPRNFRGEARLLVLMLLLVNIIGSLRFIDQELIIFGVDSNNLTMMAYGLGFLIVLFLEKKHMARLLRLSVILQAPLLVLQFVLPPGIPRLLAYLVFHLANAGSAASGFYFFSFSLNNVERMFVAAGLQLLNAFTSFFIQYDRLVVFFLTYVSAGIMLALAIIVTCAPAFKRRRGSPAPIGGALSFPDDAPLFPNAAGLSEGASQKQELNARQSGVALLLVLNTIWYMITLTAMYIKYQETTVSSTLYGLGGFAALGAVFVVMLLFNYSSLHLWSLCLICSVLGVGALHYASAWAVNAGSLCYGLGEGLGFMILFYLQGGALKRSGSYRLFQLCCLCACGNYAVVSGVFFAFYGNAPGSNLSLAFPVILALSLICLLFLPALSDRLFSADWTAGYHMVDMPAYADALRRAEPIDAKASLGLTPRESELFALLLTDASFKQIAGALRLSDNTVRFHSKNLYRKLNIQSRTELFAKYGNIQPAPAGDAKGYTK